MRSDKKKLERKHSVFPHVISLLKSVSTSKTNSKMISIFSFRSFENL